MADQLFNPFSPLKKEFKKPDGIPYGMYVAVSVIIN